MNQDTFLTSKSSEIEEMIEILELGLGMSLA